MISKKQIKLKKSKKPSFLQGPVHKTKIRMIGIGGGGSQIVSEIAKKVKKIDFWLANTDFFALKKTAKNLNRFYFGQNLTKGLGTGMDFSLAEKAAEIEKERIKKILKGQDLCLFLATLGGGVGSGATPVFTRISKELGNLNYGIFTLPFKFEGKKKMEIAKKSLEKIKPNLNAFSIVPNDKIFQIIKKEVPLKKAFSIINKNLAKILEDLIEIIYQPGLINIDFADFKAILEGEGKLAFLNTIEIENKKEIGEEIKKIFLNPLLPYNIFKAKGVLFQISQNKNLLLSEVSQIAKSIFDSLDKKAKIIFGISQNKRDQKNLKVTIFATDCQTKLFSEKKVFKKKQKIKKKILPKIEKSKKIKISKEKEIPSQIINQKQKIRRNALEVKKAVEESEKEILEKEKIWEIPAFLRKKI
jgi:cell division protein FtsZ